jgi:hypothetical protein
MVAARGRRVKRAAVACAPGTAVALVSGRAVPPLLSRFLHWEDSTMLWTLAVILFILWLLGFGVFHVAGGLIHLLLVIAVIVLVVQLLQGRRSL